MTIGNPCRGVGNVTDPLCYSSICDLEQKLSISMWKSYRGSTEKKCFDFFGGFGRGVVCRGFLCVCFVFYFFFLLWGYRSNIFLERNILSMVLSAVLCSEGGKLLDTVC